MGFGRACAPVRCAHPSSWAHCHAQRGAARPLAHCSFAAFSLYSKNKNNLPNLGRPREGIFSFNSTTEAREYTECQAFYPVVRIGSPTPSTARECCSPPFDPRGRHTHFRMRGWGEHWPPALTSQLRWSFWRTINRKKPQKITVWGCILRYQWYVEKTPRNVPVWQKIRQSIYHSLFSSIEQLQVALWTYMFL